MIPSRRPLLALLALAIAAVHAQLSGKIGISCEPEETFECMAGGLFNRGGLFKGTYMCREQSSWLIFKRNITRCLPTLAGGVLGEEGDRCGCCDGDCPSPCTCFCDNQEEPHVLLYKKLLFGYEYQCVSQGKASRWVADPRGSNYTCVPDDACPTIAPTFSPTAEPTALPWYAEYTTAPVWNYSLQEVEREASTPTFAPDGRRLRGDSINDLPEPEYLVV
ncbi:expressed unknown protein [Seminavis robusta]|uniref:Uncharacterized protein n=1 Tax=Seminavis robusta TaxID=568900 RepID=A0A9N8E0K1_9STRA|nr:expressed unknown protein [Seminavis robusta]|eukprot:Sro528_g160820.1 n/a (220) ;mRNA; r:23986-24645